jgi:hypothetical protein
MSIRGFSVAGLRGWGAALVVVLALSLGTARTARAQFFCEWPITPAIVVIICIVANAFALDATLAAPDGLLADTFLHPATQAASTILAGDVGVGIAVQMSGAVGTALQVGIPLLSSLSGFLSAIPYLGEVANGLEVAMNSPFYGGMGFMDDLMRIRLDRFWYDIFAAMSKMMSQIQSSGINNARILSSIDDANNMSLNAISHQEAEVRAKKNQAPTTEGCQFDTFAHGIGPGRIISTVASVAEANRQGAIGASVAGSGFSGGKGPSDYIQNRYQRYVTTFCDPYANGGNSPCLAMQTPPVPAATPSNPNPVAGNPVPQPLQNASVAVGTTLFGQDTIPVIQNPLLFTALQEMEANLTGFIPPPTIPGAALLTDQGLEQDERNRRYRTRAGVLSALFWDVAGDRLPATDATGTAPVQAGQALQSLRLREGITSASPTPSMQEMLRAMIESLSGPNAAVSMGESPGAIAQREVQIMAYNNLLLYRLIEKQEKQAVAHAVDAALMLERRKDPGWQKE